MVPAVEWLDQYATHPVLVVPNAGLPENRNGLATYSMTPEIMSGIMAEITKKYASVRVVGGCCGTGPEHIRALRAVVDASGKPH